MHAAEFDQVADSYDAQHRANIAVTGEDPDFFAEYKIAELARLASTLGMSVSRILDFGSGIGNSIPHFRQHFPHSDLSCADVSRRSLKIGDKRFPGAARPLAIEDRRIPADDGVFDVVFSACVFHHIDHAEHGQWLREMLRVTRPGGLLAVFEHNPLNPLTVRAVNTCPFDANARLIGARAFSARSRNAGWSACSTRYHVFFPRFLAPLRVLDKHLAAIPLGGQYSVTARKG